MAAASGALFYAQDTKRFLYLLRKGARYANTWGLVGGTIELSESVASSLRREIKEELGFLPEIKKYIPIDTFVSPDNQFQFDTFVCVVSEEFLPKLNHEHIGYSWIDSSNIRQLRLHPGLWQTFSFDVIQEKLQTITEIF